MASAASWAALTPAQKAEIELKILDTFHDFCTKERKKKQSGKLPSEKAVEDEVPETKLSTMRTYIYNFLKKRFPGIFGNIAREDALDGIGEIISRLTPRPDNAIGAVTGISDLENEIVKYWESNSVRKPIIKADGVRDFLTYDAIVNGWSDANKENSPLWKKYKMNPKITILEINSNPNRPYEGLDTRGKKIIANFIMNFFFGKAQGNMFCTFDANAGIVGKIFKDTEQMRNVIFPQTIADSATTTFTGMGGRNTFIFPTRRPNEKQINLASTLYSTNAPGALPNYTLNLENNGFNEKNPYGFTLLIKDRRGKQIRCKFSADQTEGPSVNYLADILIEATKDRPDFKSIQKKAQILSLGKYIETNSEFRDSLIDNINEEQDGLLLDIKRSGDHEAAEATRITRQNPSFGLFIFVTIDLLCALESRRLQNCTIWHYGDRIILYRFPAELTVEAKRAFNRDLADYKLKEALKSLGIIQSISDTLKGREAILGRPAQQGEFPKVIANATAGESAVVQINRGTPDVLQQTCEKILIKLLRLRMSDLREQVTTINAIDLNTVDLPVFADGGTVDGKIAQVTGFLANKARWAVNDGNGDVTYTSGGVATELVSFADSVMESFTTYIKKLNNTLKIDAPTETTTLTEDTLEKKLRIYTPLVLEGATNLFLETENTTFGYSYLPFYTFYKCLLTLIRAVEKAVEERKETTRIFLNYMNGTLGSKGELDNLHAAAQDILDQFQDLDQFQEINPIKTALKGQLLFTKMKSDQFFTVSAARVITFSAINAFIGVEQFNIGDIVPYAAAGGGQRGGGAQQYFDSADLLFQISSRSAAFIESAYSTLYPAYALNSAIDQVDRKVQRLIRFYNIFVEDNESETAQAELCNRNDIFHSLKNTFAQAIELVEDYRFKDQAEKARVFFEGFVSRSDELFTQLNTKIHPDDDDDDTLQIDHSNAIHIFNELVFLLFQFREILLTPCSCLDTLPSYTKFFTDINTNIDLRKASLELRDDLQILWEEKLRQIELEKGYEGGNSRFSTNLLITYLLSLQYNAGTFESLSLFKGNIETIDVPRRGRRALTQIKTDVLQTFPNNPALPILLLFTMIENIQNPSKYNSFFLPYHKPNFFKSKTEWNDNLWWNLVTIMNFIYVNRNQATAKYSFPRTLRGGKYPKKTRRHVKNSKRKTRRHP